MFFKGEKINDYIDKEWIDRQDFKCYICNTLFDFDIEDGKVISDMTVDRIDNFKIHSKNNCRLCCLHCNVSKGKY